MRKNMNSSATMTIVKMLESLPEQFQDRVVEHLREFIGDMRDEALWEESLSQTQEKLANFAQQARREIAEGKATPMDFEKL
jgi:hypothetical protein